MSSEDIPEDNEYLEAQEEITKKAENPSASDPFYVKRDINVRVGAVVASALLGGIIFGLMAAPGEFSSTFLSGVILAGTVGWLGFTRTGATFWKGTMKIIKGASQQQEQKPSSSEPTRICSNCGWRNPEENNYCHDCGKELDRDGAST